MHESHVDGIHVQIADSFGCNVAEGVLSHTMKRYVLDGNEIILSKETPDQHAEEFVFEENQVWCIDIVMSTGVCVCLLCTCMFLFLLIAF